MGNPLFKPSEGDQFEILRVGLHLTYSEVRQVSGMEVLIRLKGVSGRFTDSAVWQEVAPYSSRRHPRRLSERVTHVRLVRFLQLLTCNIVLL